jgi:isopropylmalate/homocitrate/citramalate synthase
VHERAALDELCVTDTQGVAHPFSFFFLIQEVRKWVDVPIAVHCHNYLGMAVANSCAAVAGGAEIVHGTFNGMGHLAGITATEEVAVALMVAFDVDLGIRYEKLYEVAKLVEKYTGIGMHLHKPVTGDMAFSKSEETRDILNLMKRQEAGKLKGLFPYLPEFVGNRAKVVMAEKVTPLAVRYNLEEIGLAATEDHLSTIHGRVRDLARRDRRMISQDELKKIVKEVFRQ